MIRLVLTLLVLIAPAACATSTFERHVAAEQWSAAAAAFTADSTLLGNERALYRAALLHSSPALPTYNPERARELFVHLLSRHPGSIHRAAAVRMIELLDEVQSVRLRAAAREQFLQLERTRLDAELRDLHTEMAGIRAKVQTQSEEREQLRAAVDRLQGMIRDREDQLRQLREELDRLKAVDLRAAPRSGGRLLP